MHETDTQKFRLALEAARQDIVTAVHQWHDGGGRDEDLALLVEGEPGGKPTVKAMTRVHLEQTIVGFDPTIAIEFVKQIPGRVPAVVDLRDVARRIFWIDLTPPMTW
jgi:hypothetical protein